MKQVPKKIESFSNDLYAEVTTEKKLIELFLKNGTVLHDLTEELEEKNTNESIQNPENPDGSVRFLLHGCNGVFTDEKKVVYFWRLSSPSILEITSQKYENAYIYLENPPMKLINGLNR